MKSLEDVRLYCFSPGRFLNHRDPLEIVESQIRGGADLFQLREKEMPKKQKLELGLKLRELTFRNNILFIVNDDVDLAIILKADGVHLGQDDIPIHYARPLMRDKIIGISTHSLEQAREAVSSGADYIGIGPVFETSTKADRDELIGPELLREIKKICRIPYIAIGGIGLNNLEAVIKAGCQRAAVISDILMAADIEDQCRQLKNMLSSANL